MMMQVNGSVCEMDSAAGGAANAHTRESGDEIVLKVLMCQHSFQVFGLDPPQAIELADLQRQVMQLGFL